jgi:hypothetical protein
MPGCCCLLLVVPFRQFLYSWIRNFQQCGLDYILCLARARARPTHVLCVNCIYIYIYIYIRTWLLVAHSHRFRCHHTLGHYPGRMPTSFRVARGCLVESALGCSSNLKVSPYWPPPPTSFCITTTLGGGGECGLTGHFEPVLETRRKERYYYSLFIIRTATQRGLLLHTS